MFRREAIKRAMKKLTPSEAKHLGQSLDHALTKPHRDISGLIITLIDGHHQINLIEAGRIKAAIKGLSSEELEWLAENL